MWRPCLLNSRRVVDPERLAAVAPLSPVPWAQRLGYLLSLGDATDRTDVLRHYVARSANETVPLAPGRDVSNALHDARWKLVVNAKVEPDL